MQYQLTQYEHTEAVLITCETIDCRHHDTFKRGAKDYESDKNRQHT